MLIFTTLMMVTLLISVLALAWPLLLARVFRPSLQGVLGTFCVLAGSAMFFSFASGLAGGSQLLAAETKSGASAEKPAASSIAASSSATATAPASEAADADTPHSTSLNTLPEDLSTDVVIPPGRPAWVESKPARNGSLHATSVCSGPFKKDSDARQALDLELEKQTAAYIGELLGSKLAPQFIRLDASQIKSELVKSDHMYHETIESPTVGSMEQYHALIEFTPTFQDRIRHEWQEVKGKWRLAQFGLFAGGAILLLGTVFGYFRVDNATRGYYTGRLQFLSAAAILAIVGAGVMAARWIAWL